MSIFKAYDIRGTVPDQLNDEWAERIGHGFATFLAAETGNSSPRIVVGRDVRVHSPRLSRAFMAGIELGGGVAIDAGVCTSPMLYCAVGSLEDAAGGAVVTASHNSKEYNGFKLCRAESVPISGDTGLKEIEELAGNHGPTGAEPQSLLQYPALAAQTAPVPAPSEANPNLWDVYWAHISRFKETWPENLKVAVDPANGVACMYVPLMKALGAETLSVNDFFDGTFPAHEANPIKAQNLVDCQDLLATSGAALGIAFDGDADRAAFIDETGQAVPCDLLTAVLARYFLAREPGASILYDLRSSHSVPEIIENAGGRPVRERVGHSFMKATLRREGCVFGGELSGHYYYRENFCADSSLITVIALLNVLGQSGQSLSGLIAGVRRYSQSGELNYRVENKEAVMDELASHYPEAEVDNLDGVTVAFSDWWFNVRASNTEPLLRLNLEAASPEALEARLAEVVPLIGGQPE